MNTEDMAMQTRCPHCLSEQYVANVIGFSEGEHGCASCGKRTIPMSREDWLEALAQTRSNEQRR